MLFGKEWIELAQGVLTLTKGFLSYRPRKRYLVDQIVNLRLRTPDPNPFAAFYGFGWGTRSNDTLCFDYGMKTVKFADNIDEAEAKYLLSLFEKKGFTLIRGFHLLGNNELNHRRYLL